MTLSHEDGQSLNPRSTRCHDPWNVKILRAFRTLPEDVFAPLRADAKAWQRVGFASESAGLRSQLALVLRCSGYRATAMHRIAHWANRNQLRGLPMLLQSMNLALHGIELTPSTPIGHGFYLAHTAGSVITARGIGANVELQGGITVGTRKRNGFPTICDGVVIGCGARVLGPITVGAHASVGANSVVLADVAPGCTVVGVPARPLSTQILHQ